VNAIRGLVTTLLAVIVMLTVSGWRWAAGLPSSKSQGRAHHSDAHGDGRGSRHLDCLPNSDYP